MSAVRTAAAVTIVYHGELRESHCEQLDSLLDQGDRQDRHLVMWHSKNSMTLALGALRFAPFTIRSALISGTVPSPVVLLRLRTFFVLQLKNPKKQEVSALAVTLPIVSASERRPTI